MKEWQTLNIEKCIDQVKYPKKILRKNFIEKGKFPIISQEQEFINGYWEDEDDLVHIIKPIIIFGDHTKILKYVNFDFVLGADGVKILKPKDFIDSKYFYYFLKSCPLKSLGYARHYRILKELDIRFPISLVEQKRIVSIVDEAFEGIDRAIANTEKNLANARELFESYLNTVFTQRDNGWEWGSLSEITTHVTDGDHQPPPKSESGIPFITISNINKQDRKVDFSSTFKVSSEYFNKLKDNRKPRRGDLLYTVTGSYGIPVIVDHDMEFCFQRHIGLIRPSNITDSKCLYYLFLSRYLLNQAHECATGTAQKTVSLSGLRQFQVPIIPKEEQILIVQKLDILSKKIHRLEFIYNQKLTALKELKQSILQKAFTGELTADTANQTIKTTEEAIS